MVMKQVALLLLAFSVYLTGYSQDKGRHFIGSDLVNTAFFTPNLHYEYRMPNRIGLQVEGGYMIYLPYGGIKNTFQNQHRGPFVRAGFNWYSSGENQAGGFFTGLFAYWGESTHSLRQEISHFYGREVDELEVTQSTFGFSLPMGFIFSLGKLELYLNLIYNRVFSVRRDDYARRGYGQPGMGILWSRNQSNRHPAKGTLLLQYGFRVPISK